MIILPRHQDETCIVIGNGPSLNSVPEDFLKSYPTFGCNFINRKPFQPTYYVCVDTRVLTDHASEIYIVTQQAELSFISEYISPNPALDKLRALPNVVGVGRSTFVFEGELFMSGNTAAYVGLKLAFFMGFKTVLLVGVDHSPGWEHFTQDYPAATHTNYQGQRFHFSLANEVYKNHGRKIVNLSAPSALDSIFSRGKMDDYRVDKAQTKA